MTATQRTRPERLSPGDTVAVVSPAGPAPAELLDPGVRFLREWGLEVRLGAHARQRHARLGYLAGSDADRARDLQDAWCDPQVSAVFCARGGYGSLRMLDHVDWNAMASAAPKAFVGSSDITALHDAFAHHVGVATIFGPMVGTNAFVQDEAARAHLRRTLFEPESVAIITRRAAQTMVRGTARGVTYGGNLSLLAASLGAPNTRPPPERGIALLEDITDQPYRLDGYLTQLLRAGWFDGATGIALGSWVECGPMEQVWEVMHDRLGALGVPVLWELGFGHCEAQRTVPLGVLAELDTDARRLSLPVTALR